LQRGLRIGRFAADGEIRLAIDHLCEALSNDRVVVNNQDSVLHSKLTHLPYRKKT
jgi:hypothetical protein